MSTWRIILQTLKLQKENMASMFLIYLGLPLALSLVMVFMFTGIDKNTTEFKVKVAFEDLDGSDLSKQYLNAVKTIGWISEAPKEDAEYGIVIPADFHKMLQGSEEVPLVIQDFADGKSGRKMLVTALESIGNEFQRNLQFEGRQAPPPMTTLFETTTLAGQKTELMQKLKNDMADGYLVYIFFMLAMAMPAGETLNRKNGLNKRVFSTPTKKESLYLADIFTFAAIGSVTSVLYLLAHKLLGNTYLDKFALFAIVTMVFVLLFISAMSLFNILIPNPNATTIIFMIPMFVQILGVSVSPSSTGKTEDGFAQVINKIRLDGILRQLFEAIREGNFAKGEWGTLGALLLVSALCIAIGVFVMNRKKEVKA